jgi:hypothetical protein
MIASARRIASRSTSTSIPTASRFSTSRSADGWLVPLASAPIAVCSTGTPSCAATTYTCGARPVVQ